MGRKSKKEKDVKNAIIEFKEKDIKKITDTEFKSFLSSCEDYIENLEDKYSRLSKEYDELDSHSNCKLEVSNRKLDKSNREYMKLNEDYKKLEENYYTLRNRLGVTEEKRKQLAMSDRDCKIKLQESETTIKNLSDIKTELVQEVSMWRYLYTEQLDANVKLTNMLNKGNK